MCRAIAGYILAQLPDTKALPKKIRREANASGAIGTPGGNSECAKILLELDFGQSQGKIKESAQFSLVKVTLLLNLWYCVYFHIDDCRFKILRIRSITATNF